MRKLPNFWYERRLWRRGFRVVVGLDEVGRGAWAGPLVVGATAFAPTTNSKFEIRNSKLNIDLERIGIDDSKRLTAKRREGLAEVIQKNCLTWAVAQIPVSVINRVGIGRATQMGFRKAVGEIRKELRVDYVLLDAFYVPRVAGLPRGRQRRFRGSRSVPLGHLSHLSDLSHGRQLAIVGGDHRSVSIAAASIIAKVYRDNLMHKLAERYTKYGWDSNVGYGTAKHQAALRKYGLTRWHRKHFVASGLREK